VPTHDPSALAWNRRSSKLGATVAIAHEQPSVGVDAHDCFARRNVAELTIELATRASRGARSTDERLAAVGLVSRGTSTATRRWSTSG
jgi:hypothetical protein